MELYDRLKEGVEPRWIADLDDCYVIEGDANVTPGYVLLLHKDPRIKALSALSLEQQIEFMTTLSKLNFALSKSMERLDEQFVRTNIEILGNLDQYLHAHLSPRFAWEEIPLAHKSLREFSQTEKDQMGNLAKGMWDTETRESFRGTIHAEILSIKTFQPSATPTA
jgi:diadenosine tetraphosphate (Ap4A) HIT family hydrolase